jgi:hypothetical protein
MGLEKCPDVVDRKVTTSGAAPDARHCFDEVVRRNADCPHEFGAE